MSWNYSGDPSASELDQVRFYVQDTDGARPLLTDEEITFLLLQWAPAYNSPLYVSGVCAEIIASKFIGEVNVSADGANVDQGAIFDRYNTLAASLRDQYHALYGQTAPTLDSIIDQMPDFTITPLSFGLGFQDNTWAGSQEYGDLRGPGHVYYPAEESPGW
jgi:hypothetical protein